MLTPGMRNNKRRGRLKPRLDVSALACLSSLPIWVGSGPIQRSQAPTLHANKQHPASYACIEVSSKFYAPVKGTLKRLRENMWLVSLPS